VTYEIEEIPDEDFVSRGCFSPPGVAPETFFPFQKPRGSNERAESVYWRKYASNIESVHERGCARMKRLNSREDKPPTEYLGARSALVKSIRDIKTERAGLTIAVEHLPDDGDRSHAHMSIIDADGGRDLPKVPPNDMLELKHYLCNSCFGSLEQFKCED
jgi:hypothetical protein